MCHRQSRVSDPVHVMVYVPYMYRLLVESSSGIYTTLQTRYATIRVVSACGLVHIPVHGLTG